MKKAKAFRFLYPIPNICIGGAQHVGDITVNALVYQYPDGSLYRDPDDKEVTVDIDSMIWDGAHIRSLLETVAEDTYNNIVEAARQHGIEKYEIVQPETAN